MDWTLDLDLDLGLDLELDNNFLKLYKVRNEKNVCVVVVVALSWYRELLTISVQQQQHKHFFLSLLYW